jgi:hypothetical protein
LHILPYHEPSPRSQVDQRIQAELRNPPAQQIIELGLGNAQPRGRLGLRQVPAFHRVRYGSFGITVTVY